MKSVNPNTGIKGMDKVLSNLNREIKKMGVNSMAGLIDAAIFIRRDMDKTPPLIPIDIGNLRASWFTSPIYKNQHPALEIGFNANYAVFVHEMIGGEINWSRPGSGPKFLEAALKRNGKEILKLIANNIKLK